MIRVYLPATFEMLQQLNATDQMPARGGWGFSVTEALRGFYTAGDEDELAHVAFQDAAEASIRLLAAGTEQTFPLRRVVVTVDLPAERVQPAADQHESVVRLVPPHIGKADVAALHVDIAESEEATKKAIAAIDAADLGDEGALLTVGDALDNYLAFYDITELPFLVELL